MNKFFSPVYLILAVAVVLGATFAVPAGSFAEEAAGERIVNSDVSINPAVTLQRWQNAAENERYSFLIGFVSMLDIERSWQGDHPRPYKESLIDCWYQGLKGMTYKELYTVIENYIATHPGDLELPLPQVIWFEVVQPKVADKITSEK